VKVARLPVAVVDDEEPIRKSLHRLMLSFGLPVESFASGEEFLDSLSHKRPACAVLDLSMPGMTGFEIQSKLAQANDDLPLIFITGDHSEDTRQRLTEAGAAGYFVKPVDNELLLAAVNEAIGKAGELC